MIEPAKLKAFRAAAAQANRGHSSPAMNEAAETGLRLVGALAQDNPFRLSIPLPCPECACLTVATVQLADFSPRFTVAAFCRNTSLSDQIQVTVTTRCPACDWTRETIATLSEALNTIGAIIWSRHQESQP